MGSTEIDIKILVEVVVTVALGTVLRNIKIYQIPYRGSITSGNMVPLFLIALRREPMAAIHRSSSWDGAVGSTTLHFEPGTIE